MFTTTGETEYKERRTIQNRNFEYQYQKELPPPSLAKSIVKISFILYANMRIIGACVFVNAQIQGILWIKKKLNNNGISSA
jgi:hypothetical protein